MERKGLFKNLDNTIFYSYWSNYSVLSLAMEKRNNSSLKFISKIHGYDLYNERCLGGRQPFKKYVDRWIDKIVFIAREGVEYYLDNYVNRIQNKEKYVICRIGVEKAVKFPTKSYHDAFRIVSCSTVSKLKRVDLIVKALAKMDFSIEWHHFGTGREMENLKNLAESILDTKPNIKYVLHGEIPNASVISFYQNEWIDCFITTSSSEGCPVSIQEALSYGIPIIGTDVGEIRHMINNNGILLSDNPSADEIANAINLVFMESKKSDNFMRENSLSIWERDYQFKKNIRKFIDVLESL